MRSVSKARAILLALACLSLYPPHLASAQDGLDSPAGPMLFNEVGREMGVGFVHTFGADALGSVVEDTTGGACWIDYDKDGYPDLLLMTGRFTPGLSKATDPSRFQRQTTCQLYHNDRGKHFTDVTARSGLVGPPYGMGAYVGDQDGDGWPDLYMTGYHGNRLYRNRHDGTFEDVTSRAGVELAGSFSTGATFLDFDNDGRLDLFVGNYVEFDPSYKYFYAADKYPGPLAFRPLPDTLFRNKGDGTYEDVSKRTMVSAQAGRTMGVAAVDFDDDGFIDVFAANDSGPSFLYVNRGGRLFTEQADRFGVALGHGNEGVASMGPEWVDSSGSGRLDLFVPDDKGGAFYVFNAESGGFEDRALRAGIAAAAAQFVGWGGGACDFDNDGLPDLFQANGAINRMEPQEALLFAGMGGGLFKDVSLSCGTYFSNKFQARGAAFADFNRDGLVDVAVITLGGRALVLRNDTPRKNHWSRLELSSDRTADPIGTRLWATAGGKRWALQVRGGSGYLSQSERAVHIGLGHEANLAKLEVHWLPSGRREVFENLAADRVTPIVEGKGSAIK